MCRKLIPLSVPNLKGNELKYVTDAVKVEWVSTAGMYVDKFESAITEYVKSRGAVSCQNGTAGIHLALKLFNIKALFKKSTDSNCKIIFDLIQY